MKMTLKILSLMTLGLSYIDATQAYQTCPGPNGGQCPDGSYIQYCNSCCMDGTYLYCNCQTGGYSGKNPVCRNSDIDTSKCGTSDISVNYVANVGGTGYLTCNNGSTVGSHAHRYGLYECGQAGAPWQCGGPLEATPDDLTSKSSTPKPVSPK